MLFPSKLVFFCRPMLEIIMFQRSLHIIKHKRKAFIYLLFSFPVCMCMCVGEREKERERNTFFLSLALTVGQYSINLSFMSFISSFANMDYPVWDSDTVWFEKANSMLITIVPSLDAVTESRPGVLSFRKCTLLSPFHVLWLCECPFSAPLQRNVQHRGRAANLRFPLIIFHQFPLSELKATRIPETESLGSQQAVWSPHT